MGLSSATNIIRYTGNGTVDTYAYTFRIEDDDHLEVVVRNTSDTETTLVKTTDYTVTGVGAANGGNVVLVNSAQAWLDGDGDLKTDYILSIKRVVPLTQDTDIRNNDSFYPSIHEDAFDYLTMAIQQVNETALRSVKNPVTMSTSVFDPTLPGDINDNPLATIIVNSGGNGFDLGPTSTALLAAESSASASASAAASSASSAATSASAASTSASSASSSASAASASASSAASSASAAAASAASIALTIFGTYAAPKTIVDATGISGATLNSTTAQNQIIFVEGDSVGESSISANPQIAAHTVIGARLIVSGKNNTNWISLDNGNGLKINGIWRSSEDDGSGGRVDNNIELFWNGSVWEEIGRMI